MLEHILNLFFSLPAVSAHGYCLAWDNRLLFLHIISNGLIFISYTAIPITIYIFVRQKHQNLIHKHLFWLFAVFIIACALTHLMGIVVIWQPYYWLQGLVMALTALVSAVTAIELARQMPELLKLPTVSQLQSINQLLAEQIAQREILEQKLRLTQFSVDTASEGIFWIKQDGSYWYFNKAAAQMLGYEPAEFSNLRIWDVNPNHQQKDWEQHWQELKSAKNISFQAPLRKKDGSFDLFALNANLIEYEGQEYNCAFMRNISVQVSLQQSLIESRNMLQTVIESIPLRIFWKDADLRYLGCNTLFAQDAGKSSPEQLIGLSDMDLNWKEQASLYQADDRYIIETDLPKLGFEEPQTTPDGGLIWIRASKVPLHNNEQAVGVLGVYEDISEHKRTAEALKTSEAVLKQAQEIAHVGHWILDLRTDKLDWSDEIYRIFGLRTQEFAATYEAFLEHVHPEDREFVNRRYSEHLEDKKDYDIVHRVILSDGSVRYVNEKCKTSFDASGKPLVSMGVVLDITERKLIEQHLKEALELLATTEAQHRLILNSIGEGILGVDNEGKATFVNEAACQMLGFDAQELNRQALHNLIHHSHFDGRPYPIEVCPMYAAYHDGIRNISVDEILWRKNGSYFPVEYTSTPIMDAGKIIGAVIVFTDITERQRTQQELLTERYRLAEIIRGTNVGTWEWNVQTGAVIFNERWANIIGYSLAELAPISIDTWIKYAHPGDLAQSNLLLEQHFRGEVDYYEFESRMQHKNGTWIWVLDRGRVSSWSEDGKPLLMRGTHQDITARKQIEAALKESEMRFRIMANTAPVLIWVADTNKLCTWFNQRWLDFTGRTMEQELGNGWADVIHPDDYQRCLDTYIAAFDKREAFIMEYRLQRYDGEYRWLFDNGVPRLDDEGNFSGYIGSCIDVTERKQAEQQIKDLLDLNQKIISQSVVGVKVFNASGQCVACNEAAAKTLDNTVDQILQQNFYNLSLWQTTHLLDIALACLRTQTPQRKEVHLILESGREVWLDYNFATFRSNHEIHLLVLIHNISEYRLAEIALEQAKSAAMQANQAKSEFIANMSHEIRTPMNAILGFSHILTDLIHDATQQYYLDAIKRSGKTLLQLINDVLDLSKIEAGKFSLQYAPVALNSLLDDIAVIFSQKLADKSVALRLEIDPTLPQSLLLDEIRLRQILLNLVGNAVKFTEHGYIRIIAKGEVLVPEHKINLLIKVHDTGIGIPKSQQEKIFAAFTQQDNQNVVYGGTGLGLTICKRLLELMHGSISVESEPGQGSCFSLNLNEVEIADRPKPASELKTLPAPQPMIQFQPSQILLVDDILLNRQLVKAYLADFKELNLSEAESAQQTLLLLQQQQFDLILMDRRLPDDDGDALCRKIRSLAGYAKVPIIMISASVVTLAEKGLPPAYDMQLNKPLSKEKLIAALQSFLSFVVEDKPVSNAVETGAEQLDTLLNGADLLALLQQRYFPIIDDWHHLGILDVDQIIEIGRELQNLADSHRCLALQQWAKQLITEAELFDLTRLTHTIANFTKIIHHLQQSI